MHRTQWSILVLFLIYLPRQEYFEGEPFWLSSLNTPEGIILAIGHAPHYVNTKRGFKEARQSGYLKLAYQFTSHVEHRLADVLSTGGIESAEFTSITTEPHVVKQVQRACVVIDSVMIRDGTFILLAVAPDFGEVALDLAQLRNNGLFSDDNLQQESPPSWTRSLIANQKTAVGSGTGYRIIGENEYLAMKDALVKIAASRSVQQSSLSRLYQDDHATYEKILSEAEVDTSIYGARVTKRWYDRNSGVYYVMISTE